MRFFHRHRSHEARSLHPGARSVLKVGAILLLVLFLLLPLSSPAKGDTQSDALRQQLAQKLAALEQANAELQTLKSELDKLEVESDAAALRLAELEVEIRDVDADISQAADDLDDVRVQLEDRLVNIYKNGGSWSMRYLEVLMVENSLASVLKQIDMVTELANQDQVLFDQVGDYLKASKTSKELLEQKKTEQNEELDRLVGAQQQLSTKAASVSARSRSLEAQAASLEQQYRQAKALEAAEAAAGAAQAQAVKKAASSASSPVTTTPPPSGGSSGPSTSSASLAEQALFIERAFLQPRQSVLTGQMIIDIWLKYDISPAMSLTVLNAESGMGSLRYGGRLVSEANNFGCIRYRTTTSWLNWPPAIPHGKIEVGGRNWMTFPSVSLGIEAWARCIASGCGRDCYRPLMRAGDWEAFADIYYGKNVPGKAKYLERLEWIYGVLMSCSHARGYTW